MGDEPEEGVFLALREGEAVALVEFDERLVHGAVAEQSGDAKLPWMLYPQPSFAGGLAFAVHGVVALAGGVALLAGHGGRRLHGFLCREAVDLAKIVFDGGKLAADAVDAYALYPLLDDAHAWASFDRLLLLGVANEDELAAGVFAQSRELPGLPGG